VYTLRLAGQPTLCLVKERGYYLEAHDWWRGKTDIRRETKLSPGGKKFKGNLQEVGIK